MAKMALKARQMQSKMKSIKAAGKSGAYGVIVDGPGDLVDIEYYIEELVNLFPDVPEKTLVKIITNAIGSIKKAFKDAKSQAQKKMAEGMNMDEFRDIVAA